MEITFPNSFVQETTKLNWQDSNGNSNWKQPNDVMHIICNKRIEKIDVPNMQKQNNKYMHTLGAMCLIKNEKYHNNNNKTCAKWYLLHDNWKKIIKQISCNMLHPFSSFPKMKNATCICNILIPQKCCQMHFENARASHQCWE